jgi:hypothetical protein
MDNVESTLFAWLKVLTAQATTNHSAADYMARSFFTKHTALRGFGTALTALFAIQEREHTAVGGLFSFVEQTFIPLSR